MTVFFTSDLHFGHENIIRYCRRPFFSVAEMDAGLVEKWNALVAPEDIVYLLGDVSFRRPAETTALLESLSGSKYFVRGNHDGRWLLKSPVWAAVIEPGASVYLPLSEDTLTRVVVQHYPPGALAAPGKIYLHGHSHGNKALSAPSCYDVGVDANDYSPVPWEHIAQALGLRGRDF